MAVKKKKKRVVRYRRRHSVNIGVLFFALIFLYIVFYISAYFARDKVSIYEVVEGKNAIISNYSYSGLALRSENVVNATDSGYVNFYVKNGGRISKTTTVYTLDESGTLAQILENSSNDETDTLSDENVSQISYSIGQFVHQFNDVDFGSIYDFKYDLNSSLLEYINLNKLQSLNANADTSGNNFKMLQSPVSGIAEFYTDGYEGVTPDKINEKSFVNTSYKKNNVASGSLVEAGAPLFKVISSEDWNIMIKLDAKEVKQYAETTSVKVRFLKDNITTSAGFEMMNIDGKYYGKLSLGRYMIRYADYRFLDIQILGSDTKGLKIPKSSVCKKEFYTIPVEYMINGGAGKEVGFNKEVIKENGDQEAEFISPDIYKSDEQYYYVSKNDVDSGTVLIKSDSSSKFQVGTATANLDGVYNVNDGFTRFRRVDIVAESNEYYIVSAGTDFGVQIFDHIVLDSSLVKENQIVYK